MIRSAIIDTGAIGSFVSGNSDIAKHETKSNLSSDVCIKTADERILLTGQTIEAEVVSSRSSKQRAKLTLYVIPERDDIMGHGIILGIDAIKLLGITIEQINGIMTAHVNSKIVAEEFKMLGATVLEDISLLNQADQDELAIDPFEQLVDEYSDIFAESANTLINFPPMSIELSADFSSKARLRPHSKDDILEIDRQVKKLIDNDIVEESKSTFSANVHLVPKKNGTKRMVIDYRFLNDITVKDHYALPQISNMFRALRDVKYFSALDCNDGFLQIAVKPEDRHKTALITEFGGYQYKRCPFGFTMVKTFRDGLYKRCVIYIDDVLVFGKTQSELLDNLGWVFNRCRAKTVKLKRTKCAFNQKQVEFLGFQISQNEVSPVHGKYDPVGMIEPTKISDVRAILGSFNHYARFIENYADKTAPIRKLTRKDVKFNWSKELSDLVTQLKDELNKATYETIADSLSPKYVKIFITPTPLEVTCFDLDYNLVGRSGCVLNESEKNHTSVEFMMKRNAQSGRHFVPIIVPGF